MEVNIVLSEQNVKIVRWAFDILDLFGTLGGIQELLISVFEFIFLPIAGLSYHVAAIQAFYKV